MSSSRGKIVVEDGSDDDLDLGPRTRVPRVGQRGSDPRTPRAPGAETRVPASMQESIATGTMGDGEVEGGKPGVLASVVVIDDNVLQGVCLSAIGTSKPPEKVCFNSRHSCEFRSHLLNKVNLADGDVMIAVLDAARPYALNSPKLRMTDFEEEGLELHSLTEAPPMDISILVQTFNERKHFLEQGDQHALPQWFGATPPAPRPLEEVVEAVRVFATPFKTATHIKSQRHRNQDDMSAHRKLFNEMSELPGLNDSSDSLLAGLMNEPYAKMFSVYSERILGMEHRMAEMLQLLESSIEKSDSALDLLDGVNTSLQIAVSNIGACPGNKAEHYSPTLWSAILDIHDDLARTQKSLQDTALQVTDGTSAFVKHKKKFTQLHQHYKATNQDLQGRMIEAEDKLDAMPAGLPGAPPLVDADLREDVNRLNVWYVEQQRKELTEEDASPTHLIWQDIVNRLDTVEVDVGDMKRRLTGNNTYEWDEHVISSAADVKQILGPDLGDAPLGWFVDVMTVVCQFDESFQSGKDWSDTAGSAKKASTDPASATNVGTLKHVTPLYLFAKGEGKTVTVEPEEGFGFRLKDHRQYATRPVNPIRQDIQKKTANVLSAVRGAAKGNTPPARLAQHLAPGVGQHVSSLTSLISDWHDELVQQCDYKTDVAWKFIGYCIRCIFEHLSHSRIAVSNLTDISNEDTKAEIIWALLQTHIKMDELIAVGYKAHPIIITAMSNFNMKTRVDRSSVDEAVLKAQEASKASAACEKKVAAVEAEIKAAKQNLGNKIAQLEKKK